MFERISESARQEYYRLERRNFLAVSIAILFYHYSGAHLTDKAALELFPVEHIDAAAIEFVAVAAFFWFFYRMQTFSARVFYVVHYELVESINNSVWGRRLLAKIFVRKRHMYSAEYRDLMDDCRLVEQGSPSVISTNTTDLGGLFVRLRFRDVAKLNQVNDGRENTEEKVNEIDLNITLVPLESVLFKFYVYRKCLFIVPEIAEFFTPHVFFIWVLSIPFLSEIIGYRIMFPFGW